MKKFLITLLLCLSVFMVNAQKQYVSLYVNLNDATNNWVSARLSGNIPPGMKSYYAATYDKLTEGDLINMLAENNFTIERMAGVGDTHAIIIFSNVQNSGYNDIITYYTETINPNAQEIARYNLQGMKIDSEEPGIQIVVYSDYNAKIIVNNK